jgi:hypothetical protein
MSAWLAAQFAYAAMAWYFAARVVAVAYRFGGTVGRELSRTVRELRRADRDPDIARLAEALHPSPIASLLELTPETTSPIELVAEAERVSSNVAPPIRLLRSIATAGTMLGLLSAVATLRLSLDAGTATRMETTAKRAFDSAVVGFVTALPCWTAIALTRRRARETYSDLERIVLAMRAERSRPGPEPDGAAPDEPSSR